MMITSMVKVIGKVQNGIIETINLKYWRGIMRKYALPELIGKTISAINVIYRRRHSSQLWLTFTDGTCYEWYCWDGEIAGSKYLNQCTYKELTVKGGTVKFDSTKEELSL